MGTIGLFYPHSIRKRILEANFPGPIFGFVGKLYEPKHSVWMLRATGGMMYAFGVFVLYWTFLR